MNFNQTKSKLEGVNSKLESINARMGELQPKGHLSLVEQDELDNLTRSNNELERRKQILESLEAEKFEEAKGSVRDFMNDKSFVNSDFGIFKPTTWFKAGRTPGTTAIEDSL